jgi:hypothetical protein
MGGMLRLAALPALLAAVLLTPLIPVRADEIGQALHDNRWADADALAATSPDPVARKLVLYFRVVHGG